MAITTTLRIDMTLEPYSQVFDTQTGRRGTLTKISADGITGTVSTPYGKEERPMAKLMQSVSVHQGRLQDMEDPGYWSNHFENLDKAELAELAAAAEAFVKWQDHLSDYNPTEVALMAKAAKTLSGS